MSCNRHLRRKLKKTYKYAHGTGNKHAMDCLEDFSLCPACNKNDDIALILPCSHTICGRCVATGEKTGSHPLGRHDPRQSVCSVPCPCCRQPIELPCWTWSSAVSCLPRYPTLRSEHAYIDTGFKDRSAESHPDQVRHCEPNNPLQTMKNI